MANTIKLDAIRIKTVRRYDFIASWRNAFHEKARSSRNKGATSWNKDAPSSRTLSSPFYEQSAYRFSLISVALKAFHKVILFFHGKSRILSVGGLFAFPIYREHEEAKCTDHETRRVFTSRASLSTSRRDSIFLEIACQKRTGHTLFSRTIERLMGKRDWNEF